MPANGRKLPDVQSVLDAVTVRASSTWIADQTGSLALFITGYLSSGLTRYPHSVQTKTQIQTYHPH